MATAVGWSHAAVGSHKLAGHKLPNSIGNTQAVKPTNSLADVSKLLSRPWQFANRRIGGELASYSFAASIVKLFTISNTSINSTDLAHHLQPERRIALGVKLSDVRCRVS